ncbi:RDD family protein [Candidatus Microgenomates bacterium]|nr:RDD family protein [Candidatus Microgenomates bacterium]
MKYAGFWRRFAGAFIDGLIVGVIPGMLLKDGTGNILSFLLGLAYSIWMLSTYSATVGMMILKIKILKENGGKVTYQDAILRYFASILSAIALFLGYLWMIWDPKKQTWHDKLAKTVVVKT